ncbi:MAG: hypothetical protein ACP5D5_08860 [Acidithiobacillus sp.]|uniref:hypothetical protein n=1 Tax=Acidithiobacillus sp. TaxID=1872118 RepID=UPI003CFCB531
MAQTPTKQPNLDLNKLAELGQRLSGTFSKYKTDRIVKDEEWLSNLRQFKGIYGEDVIIPPGRSKAFPRLTRAKCVTAKARLMDMLFPAGEKNWAVERSPRPQLGPTEFQAVLARMQQKGTALTRENIDAAMVRFADRRASRMEEVIASQFQAMQYEELVRKVVNSAVIYGTGVLKGPFVEQGVTTEPVQDPMTGQWTLAPVTVFRPVLEFVQIWDFFPDLSANDWNSCDGAFFRHVLTRHEFRQLAKRPDFIAKNIQKWLSDNASGNYQVPFYRNYMKALGFETLPSGTSDRIEIMEYWGYVSGHQLKDIGLIPDGENASSAEVPVNIWMVDNTVIKAVLNPIDGEFKPYHVFTYEQDDTSLLGYGIPTIMEDTQRAINAATRMLLDNASVTTGPIFEVNVDLLTPNGDADELAIRPFKVFTRESAGDGTVPAIRQIPVVNHVPDLMDIVTTMRQFATEETAISQSAVGDVEPSQESLRTSSGISMLMGASMIQIRDTVKNFDRFTKSVVNAMIRWNNTFNMDPEIKGDHQAAARGSTSLVAREVRMAALDQLAMTLNPEDAAFIDRKHLLIERMKLHDLPIDDILKTDEEIAEAKQQAEQQQQAQMQLSMDKVRAEIQMQMATAFMNIAKGDAAANQAQAQFYESIMQTLGAINEQNTQAANPGTGAAATAATAGAAIQAIQGVGGPSQAGAIGAPSEPNGLGQSGAIPQSGAGLPGIGALAGAAAPG